MYFSRHLSEQESKEFEQKLRSLLLHGKVKGELTLDEILNVLPHTIIETKTLEDLIETLEQEGVQVIQIEFPGNKIPLRTRMMELLSNESEGLRWIKSSALTERAFWIGASQAVKQLGLGSYLENSLYSPILKTLFERSTDDTFKRTNLGHAYLELNEEFEKETGNPIKLTDQIQSIVSLLNSQDHEWRSALLSVNDGLKILSQLLAENPRLPYSKTESDAGVQSALRENLRNLEESLRKLSLIETSHKLEDRFKS